MKLFFSPLACSMATRITLEELGRSAEYIEIDPDTRLAPDGREVHPMGMVPVLHTDDGRVVTENAAILQFVAADTALVPDDPWQRTQLQQWLSFIGTELHKLVFAPLLDEDASADVKAYALGHAAPRLEVVARRLEGRAWLLDQFSVADIYLATVLNWAQVTPVKIEGPLAAFVTRMRARPAVANAFAGETSLYLAQQARRRAS